jgi:hypothetical protein
LCAATMRRVRHDLRALNRAANQALGGRWFEAHHAANHAKFGPRAKRTIPSEVPAVPSCEDSRLHHKGSPTGRTAHERHASPGFVTYCAIT